MGGHYRHDQGWLRLNFSESTFGCSPHAREAVSRELGCLNRYPDAMGQSLTTAVAEKHDCHPDQIVLGNGVDELLLLSALALVDSDIGAVVTANTYAGHANAVAAARAHYVEVPLTTDLRVYHETITTAMAPGRIVYVCNPHNPTGSALSAGEVRALAVAAAEAGATVVFDEAYLEFTYGDETASAVPLVREGLPVVVLRTFSKIHGLAALRCGYAVASPATATELRRVKNVVVFNVNRLALVAAEASLRHPAHTTAVRDRTRAVLTRFRDGLRAEPWAAPQPSVANFALLRLPWPADVVRAELARRRLLVRGCADLGLPRHIRISMGDEAEMDQAAAILRATAAHLIGQSTLERGNRGWD
ncbi:pyridoxal phosphate-dependent aminotransferase [Longispora urticae]